MKAYYSFLFLGLLGLSLGQGYGGSSHGSSGGFTIVDPFSLDDYGGSSVIMLDTNDGGYVLPNPSEEYLSHTPKPKRGAGVAQGSEIGLEGDPQGEDIQVIFEGRPLKIFCNLTAEGGESTATPKTDIPIEWFKDGKQIEEDERFKIIKENFTLVIEKADRGDAGDYKCVLNTAADKLSRDHKIIFLEIKRLDKSQNVDEKQPFSIECPVDGIPEPAIIWMKNQKPMYELMLNDSRISLGPNSRNITNGTLTIANAEWGDRGNYSCNITIFSYNFEKWTFLRVKDVYAALWPFIGIVIEVVILGIIIIIFEKRRAKAEFDESDTDQGNDQ